ncbi:lysophospholipase [Desulfosporosinus sp. HMP52]|uniref:alpha/beta hydrolase n=1 Tax=Desulfosporosinus sp. HMP52 TaxID=1487923 RepID=UPI00051FDC24|nr:alpha/beta hydrolase [Desulfosporosinus sp. HMP52]KGK86528.1 lysophospholipase [Desulfosporosinus sp. HMP52]
MKYTEFEFRTNDGTELFAREWQPISSKLRGVVFLVHGLGEHSGRYANLAQKLTQAGFALSAFDLRGHGKSQGRRGHSPSIERLLDDITCFKNECSKRLPGLPSFLYGHSLGGNLVLNYVLRRQPQFSGVVVTSPWLKLAVEPPALVKLFVRFLSKLWPTFTFSGGLLIDALSHDPEVIIAYQEDPYVHNKISLGLFTAMDCAGLWAIKNADQFNLPLLLMHGGGDKITSPEGSKEFAAFVPKNCMLKIWRDLYHELHNEPSKEEILTYVINWLATHSERQDQ